MPDHPDYDWLHWRPPHTSGVRFGELDSYDIRGLSAMILRWVPFHRIRYILGATGEGSRSLNRHPAEPLSQYNTIWIEDNESLRAWLLSNPVLQDPLDLLVYGYRDEDDPAPETPELRGRDYLDEDAVHNWGADPDAPVGQMHFRARAPGAGAEDGQNNEAVEQVDQRQDQHQHKEIVITSSLAGRDTKGIWNGDEINTGESRDVDAKSRDAQPAESPIDRIPLRIQTWILNRERRSRSLQPPPA